MDIGLAFFFRNPSRWARPFSQFYQEQLRLVQYAEEYGYDTIWLSEHHFVDDGYSPSVLPIASAIATMTKRIRIGTNVLLLPLHNAVRVAEDAAIVDILSSGRLDLGLAQGYALAEFKGYGIPLNERGSRFEEGVNVIRGMWEQEPFSFTGKHYQLEDIHLHPKPVQAPSPPLWGGARSDKAVERCARLGLHFLGSGVAHTTEVFDAALRRYGRDPRNHHMAQLRFVHVAPTRGQAWDEVQDHLHYMLNWYARVIGEAEGAGNLHGEIPPLPKPADLRNSNMAILGNPAIGTPDEVTAMLLDMSREMRMTHLIAASNFAGMNPEVSRRALQLFAREVMPTLKPL